MTITEARKNAVDFSDPYYTAGLIIMVRPDDNRIKGINDLQGKKIGVQIGTTGANKALSKELKSNSSITPTNPTLSSPIKAWTL